MPTRGSSGPTPSPSGGLQRRLEDFGLGPAPEAPTAPAARPAALPGIWEESDGSVVHPLLRDGALRSLPFQVSLARTAIEHDTLAVLPTGLGKTVIAGLVAAEVLRRGTGKVLFLAPTRPLVRQHAETFARWFVSLPRACFTGTVQKPVREGGWGSADAVFATPQVIANDLAQGRYDLKEVGLLVVDEAHRTVGNYSYVPIAERYATERPRDGRLLALTASPGGNDERIEEVVRHLGIQRVEARTRDDPDVRGHVQPVEVDYRWVRLPAPVVQVQAHLERAAHDEARKLQRMGYLRKKPIASLSVKDLVALRGEIFARPGPMVRKFGPLFHQLILLHLHHAQDRLETQGVEPFLQYLERVGSKPKPARGDRAFLALPPVVQGKRLAARFLRSTKSASHPKLDLLARLVRERIATPGSRPPRILVFAQYRDTVQGILERMRAEGWAAGRFVGQATRDADDPGMSQREQAQMLDGFRAGRFPILVATSVAEEGLDIPDVDLVVFFEAIPSEIRTIQRRGRTGRSSVGRVVVLLTRETRDVGYQKAEARRERAMDRIVDGMARKGRAAARPDPP